MSKVKIGSLILVFLLSGLNLSAQELNARVNVNTSRLGNNVNRNAFVTLQKSLNTFMNNRKWTQDALPQMKKLNVVFY